MRTVVALVSIVLLGGCSGREPAAREPTLAAAESSPEAAVALVRNYYRLVEAGQLAEAAALREDGLQEDVAPFLSLQAQVAGPRRVEGSSRGEFVYANLPVALTGRFVTGGDYRAAGQVIVRRARDPDGAGGRARRWRIHRLEVRASGGPPIR